MSGAAFEKPVTGPVANIKRELAVGEDLAFQRRWWRFEGVVWAIFVAAIGLDLVGAFGRGPLANAAAKTADGSIEATYERIERAGTPSMMTVSRWARSLRAVRRAKCRRAIDWALRS